VGIIKRVLLGRPLPTSATTHERLSRPAAIAAFGLDALSSIAYAPQEILFVLVLAGAAGTALTLPVAAAIVLLLAIVTLSYRQTIFAYPNGGGSYVVARENLGTQFGLVAAAALMIDYLLVVAVSVTAGVQELTSAVPALYDQRVVICVGCIALMVLANLRGIRESGTLFSIPTYAFIATLGTLVIAGVARSLLGTLPHAAPPEQQAIEPLSLFLVLRAFAGGCTALTGIEAIANGVPTFRPPETRNAAATLASCRGSSATWATASSMATGSSSSDCWHAGWSWLSRAVPTLLSRCSRWASSSVSRSVRPEWRATGGADVEPAGHRSLSSTASAP
jgi:amino acid transporter